MGESSRLLLDAVAVGAIIAGVIEIGLPFWAGPHLRCIVKRELATGSKMGPREYDLTGLTEEVDYGKNI